MIIEHKHHIIPRHVGGTDEPSNLVLLTIEDHAIAHKVLYHFWKREQDKIAWLALSGQISGAEASILAKKTPEFRMKKRLEKLGKPQTLEHRVNMGRTKIGNKYFLGRKHSTETKCKMAFKKAKRYLVNGKEIFCLKAFCEEYNLNYNSVKAYVSMGRIYQGLDIKRVYVS